MQNPINKKTAPFEAVPGGAASVRCSLVGSIGLFLAARRRFGQGGSQATLWPVHSQETRIVAPNMALLAISGAPPAFFRRRRRQASARPILAPSTQNGHKKRSDFSDLPLPGDKSGDAGGVDRARTYDLHDVNVAL